MRVGILGLEAWGQTMRTAFAQRDSGGRLSTDAAAVKQLCGADGVDVAGRSRNRPVMWNLTISMVTG